MKTEQVEHTTDPRECRAVTAIDPDSFVEDAPASHDALLRFCRHKQLRAATSGVHSAIDVQVSAEGFFATSERYAIYLQRMLAFQKSFDAAACGIRDDWLGKWGIPQRVSWLADDLAVFDRTPPCELASATARAWRFANASEVLGGLYVVMGAGLGARVLLARAQPFKRPSGGGVAYLRGLSETPRWPEFLEFLNTTTAIDENDMCQGALRTFECVAAHLSGGDAE